MTPDSFVRQGIALILSLSLLSPMIAFAEIEATSVVDVPPVSPTEPVPVPPVEETTEPAPTQPTEVQDTAPTQEAVTADVLQGASNPEVASSTDQEIIPIVETTSSEPIVEEIPVVAESAPELAPDEIPVAATGDLTIVADSLTASVQTVSEDFTPLKDLNESLNPDFVMSISGTVIPAKKDGVVGTASVTTPVTTAIDSVTGIMTVSGSCTSPYYVVLIFKNQTDYDTDPRSFIVNRAYPCEGGSFAYSIDRLPPKLKNGTYYLMIGEQGETGSWTPASGMTEITINRSN